MKKFIPFLILLFNSSLAYSQSLPDSVINQYNLAQKNSAKGKVLINYIKRVMQGTAIENVAILLKQHDYFITNKDETGSNYINLGIGIVSWRAGEFTIATKYIIPVLQYFEKTKILPAYFFP